MKIQQKQIKNDYLLPASILISAIIIATVWIYTFGLSAGTNTKQAQAPVNNAKTAIVLNQVLPPNGVTIPVVWNNLGKQMIQDGVIDKYKFTSLYSQRGGLNDNEKQLLYGNKNGKLEMNKQNAGFLLNLFWAFGLANKNPILENGPMLDPKYGGNLSLFASTGGWSLAQGDAVAHYSKHTLAMLTKTQQALVERVSQNIYRPCCNNPAYFPDCNHGMAMLGLLELMASQNVSEKDMYKTALQVNSYWFPNTYTTIATYFKKRGVNWSQVNPKEVLGYAYSSASGYKKVLSEVAPSKPQNGSSCGA